MSTIKLEFAEKRTYLESKENLLKQIAKCKFLWQVSVWEGAIEKLFFQKAWNETQSHWIVSSHCNDLQTACLIKRCEIIGQ